MLRSRFVRKTYYASPQCTQDIDAIKDKYGVSTDSDAIRLSLALVAGSPPATLPVAKRKAGKSA